MADIFDEVEEIMGDLESEMSELSTAKDEESNFNEAELQDIMSEIENLEKEFDSSLMEAAAPKETLQQEIDREMEMSAEIEAKVEVEPEAELEDDSAFGPEDFYEVPKTLAFEKKPIVNTSLNESPVKNSEISFEACGQMNLNLAFKIGDETAKLTIDPAKGLLVLLDGVELCINQEIGCSVTMSNGVKFTIPLTSSEASTKKKSA